MGNSAVGRVLVLDSCCIIIDYAVFASHDALGGILQVYPIQEQCNTLVLTTPNTSQSKNQAL
jgi:hypothetical protein